MGIGSKNQTGWHHVTLTLGSVIWDSIRISECGLVALYPLVIKCSEKKKRRIKAIKPRKDGRK